MTAKNPHSTTSVRDQWTNQRVASRQGGEAPSEAVRGFGIEPAGIGTRQPEQLDAQTAGQTTHKVTAPEQAREPQSKAAVAAPSAAQPSVQASVQMRNTATKPQAQPAPVNPMVARRRAEEQHKREEQQAAAAVERKASAQRQAIPVGRREVAKHLEAMSPKAREYSRYQTQRYEPGSIVASTAQVAPAQELRPFVLYGVGCIAVTLVWYAWTQATLDGSIMGSSSHFFVGMCILACIMGAGVAFGAIVAVLSRGKGDMSVSTAIALAFGKTAVAMLLSVIVWFAAMLLAAG